MQGFKSAQSSALRFCSCGGLQYVQRSPAFDQPADASTVSNRCTPILERCNSCSSINWDIGIDVSRRLLVNVLVNVMVWTAPAPASCSIESCAKMVVVE